MSCSTVCIVHTHVYMYDIITMLEMVQVACKPIAEVYPSTDVLINVIKNKHFASDTIITACGPLHIASMYTHSFMYMY